MEVGVIFSIGVIEMDSKQIISPSNMDLTYITTSLSLSLWMDKFTNNIHYTAISLFKMAKKKQKILSASLYVAFFFITSALFLLLHKNWMYCFTFYIYQNLLLQSFLCIIITCSLLCSYFDVSFAILDLFRLMFFHLKRIRGGVGSRIIMVF